MLIHCLCCYLLYFSSQLIVPLQASECMIVRDKYDRAARMSRNVIAGQENHWPNGTVPYSFGNNFTQLEKAMIYLSMRHIQNNSGVQFIPRLGHHANYVNITNDESGCFVRGLGYNSRRGPQKLNLMRHGCFRIYIIVHELLHVLGFMHEQNRPDRDQYLNIYWDNIVPSVQYYYQFARAKFPNEEVPVCDFTRVTPYDNCYNGDAATTYGLPYDYLSVMHYPSTAFSRNGNVTMLPKNYTGPMGAVFGNGLTELDIQKLNRTYPEQPEDEECTTTAGAKCVFPFKYKYSEFTMCTTVDNFGVAWCATAVNNKTKTYTSFGICNQHCDVMPVVDPSICQTTSGFKCVFPFAYKGVNYTSCTEVDFPGSPWCATATNNGEYNGNYGVCGKGC